MQRQRGVTIASEQYPIFFRQRLIDFDDVVDDRRQIDNFGLQRHFSGVRLGQQQQVVCQAGQPFALFCQQSEDVLILGHAARFLQCHFDRGPHGGQRTAQFVRGVGRKPVDLFVVIGQPVEHVVDRFGELIELVIGSRAGQAGREIFGIQSLCGGDALGDGPQRPASQPQSA